MEEVIDKLKHCYEKSNLRLILSEIGKGVTRLKENFHISEQDLRMQVRRKMFLLTRSLMQLRSDMDLNLERNKIKVVEKNHFSVGYVVTIITRMIFRCIRVLDLRSTVGIDILRCGLEHSSDVCSFL